MEPLMGTLGAATAKDRTAHLSQGGYNLTWIVIIYINSPCRAGTGTEETFKTSLRVINKMTVQGEASAPADINTESATVFAESTPEAKRPLIIEDMDSFTEPV
jgi:hypothetical protein